MITWIRNLINKVKLEIRYRTFCAVPLFDPELLDKQSKGVYNDNMD